MSQHATKTVRRHDLDWLRVIVFGLLIPFHVAVGFVPWDVYPYENAQRAGRLTEMILSFTSQWRLPVLFLISGMGTAFALKHRTAGQFAIERTKRLLVPLVFGMNFIIIFQGYYSALDDGRLGSPFDFAIGWWEHFGRLAHLWFLMNLFIYSLLCAPLFLYLRNNPKGRIVRSVAQIMERWQGWGLLLLPSIPLIVVELLFKPWASGVKGRGYEFPWYLVIFIFGYLCICAKNSYWGTLVKIRYTSLSLGLVCSLLLFVLAALGKTVSPEYADLILRGGWLHTGDSFWGVLTFPGSILHSLNTWAWCMVLFSWGARFLNKSNRLLTYLNHGVYPFYIVHLPVSLIALFYLKDWEIFWFGKFLLINAITFAGCFVVFEAVKRTPVTRLLFGIKPRPAPTATCSHCDMNVRDSAARSEGTSRVER